ncbi:hypothetical protein [Alicyclobacillus shizuokensis]|uniref:hypothetical protein n=1 Tax=Alicyclobacillus shizuokensis TaxID=392014 RepID=UPI000ACA603F|nr:hypothetical protein [Alicyclobacillus shizuokensis]MCL6626049.1 hypothetical protein [Alicyclobacillus shizuokensis]
MAQLHKLSENKIRIEVGMEDALRMVQEAAQHVDQYTQDIVTIYEKMPAFDYTNFCFYAYDSARLFEWVLGEDPRGYSSFALDAPDAFFYILYGGMAALLKERRRNSQRGRKPEQPGRAFRAKCVGMINSSITVGRRPST